MSPDELADEEEYKDIVEDMREECGKHGALRRVIIPRPTPAMPNPVGVAKVRLLHTRLLGLAVSHGRGRHK